VLVLGTLLCVALSFGAFAGKIGIVLDSGGLGDMSFNDAAYAGVTRALADFGYDDIVFAVSQSTADFVPNLRSMARRVDIDLIIGNGYMITEAIGLVAAEFPNKKFFNIDGWVEGAENVRGFLFREGDGSAIIGALAALQALELGYNKVGVIFGIEGPVMYHFEAGYRMGIDWALTKYQQVKGLAAKPTLTLLMPYSGTWYDPALGKQMMLSQVGEGVVGSYNVSGGVGIGMMQGVVEAHANAGTTKGAPYYFGVDQDQDWWEMGRFCLMSMLKRVDNAAYDACRMVAEGNFEPGRTLFGIAVNGVYVSQEADLIQAIDNEIAKGNVNAADKDAIIANWQANRATVADWIWTALDEFETAIVGGDFVIPFVETLQDIQVVRTNYPLN
jgi:basic membrane protein A